ncbi:hypothetical protein [Moritella dasanensis]|uniref:hypothetical protein n=1 Tax=Moritella dasanensis TaxID=428031 RepID=UPI0003671B0C|nr:hypothetical protein [Moritella dasanensis]
MLMNSEPSPALFISTFNAGITQVKEQNKDDFHNKLYFSNIISLMEQYLSNLFIFEIANNHLSLQKLASHDKFRTATVSISFALNNSIKEHLIKSMKSLVWHRLNDVDMYYKKVMNIRLNISGELLSQLEIRHHLVHRNGYKLDGSTVEITDEVLNKCIVLVETFVGDINRKYVAQKANL